MENTQTNVESLVNTHAELPKIFREKAIWGGTFLGGPLAAGYIMAHNYKAFGELGKAKLSLIISIVATFLLFLLVFSLPTSTKIPNQMIPFIYTGIAYGMIHYYQGKKIEAHEKKGGKFYSGWRVAGVALISLIIISGGIFSYIYFTDVTINSSSKSFGITENEIYYKSSNITEPEIDKIAKSLQDVDAFTNDRTIDVYAEKKSSNYEITFTLTGNAAEDPDAINNFQLVRNEMQKEFPANHILIKLSSEGSFSNVKKVIQ